MAFEGNLRHYRFVIESPDTEEKRQLIDTIYGAMTPMAHAGNGTYIIRGKNRGNWKTETR
jgi:hypothetical protein